MSVLVVDAGPLVALHDADDAHHRACAELLGTFPGRIVVPTLVIGEVAHFLQTRLNVAAEVAAAANFATGMFEADAVHPVDWLRIAEIVRTYADARVGLTDASVLACAERRGATLVATLDRRDFTLMRPRHVDSLTLLP